MWSGQIVRQMVLRVYCNLRLRAAAAGTFACVWWGVLYPELCFADETYTQVNVVEGQEIETKQSDCRDILHATGDEIAIKSRLLEWIEQKLNKQ